MALKQAIEAQLKEAMKQGKKKDRDALRLIMAAIKQVEVDERIAVEEARLISILDKMLKQRRESIDQYQQAHRDDLVAKEQFEVDVIQRFMPAPLPEGEIEQLIQQAIAEAGGATKQNRGRIMSILKPQIQGRADVAQVSAKVMDRLI